MYMYTSTYVNAGTHTVRTCIHVHVRTPFFRVEMYNHVLYMQLFTWDGCIFLITPTKVVHISHHTHKGSAYQYDQHYALYNPVPQHTLSHTAPEVQTSSPVIRE